MKASGEVEVSQNRPGKDRRGVLAGFYEKGWEAQPMAALVTEYGLLDDL